jgi:hypothetical protein
MKYPVSVFFILAFACVKAQSIVGTWQQVGETSCIQTELKESETEKELLPAMGGTQNSVAKLIRFFEKGGGEEGIFSKGSKKGSGMNAFQYKVIGQELQFLDKRSGIITQRFIVDELTEGSLKIHNAMKDCEARTFTRVK